MTNETILKLRLLGFLEKKGAYSHTGQAVLPGGNFADLTEFMVQSGTSREQLENVLQKMRSSWQIAAFWLDDKWMAFYTPLGHEELNRLRGSDISPPGPDFDINTFWLTLEYSLKQRGLNLEAQQVNQLREQPAVLELSRRALQKLNTGG